MICGRRSVWPAHSSCVTAATAASGRFAAGFLEPVGKHGFGVLPCPLVGEQLIETWIVIVQAQQQFTQVDPRFEAVTLRAGEDCEQDGRPRSGLLAAQEQPVFSPDRLVTQRSFTDAIDDRQPTILRIMTECLPLIAGGSRS